ncbi:MAG: hypothetical protein CL575_11335 [Altererythrobacter sp.]|nr:hypothetical protein [Altererythrobacter sp.]MBK63505.1 hypothetical protein [Altererythrobacter sp.]|tara:strand:+ start:13267 stop:13830 length:564 start_codon:yes stop_codon:yes gene_type:complete
MTVKRPSLLMLTASAAAMSALAHGVAASGAREENPASQAAPTRLGSAIQSEVGEKKRTARERERALDLREQAIKASEKRLEANIQSQQKKPGSNKDAPAAAKTKEQTEAASTLDQLARIYQSMKPKQAAPVFEQLDMDVQIAVARKMRERSTAQILAAMTPSKAANLSMALAGKRPKVKIPAGDPPG